MIENKIIKIDCFNFFEKLSDNIIDFILTDPPYGINFKDGIAKNPLKIIKNDNIDDIDWGLFFKECYRILKPNKMIYLCCRADFLMRLAPFIQESQLSFVHDFIWAKGDMGYGNLNIMGNTHELLIGLCKGKPEKSRQIKIDGELKKRTPAIFYGKVSKKEYYKHPMQKPIGLLAYLILNRTDKNDIVFDPFCGVASTLIAAKMTERNYIGCEIDVDFFKLSNERLNDENHLNLFKNLEERFTRFNGATKLKSLDE